MRAVRHGQPQVAQLAVDLHRRRRLRQPGADGLRDVESGGAVGELERGPSGRCTCMGPEGNRGRSRRSETARPSAPFTAPVSSAAASASRMRRCHGHAFMQRTAAAEQYGASPNASGRPDALAAAAPRRHPRLWMPGAELDDPHAETVDLRALAGDLVDRPPSSSGAAARMRTISFISVSATEPRSVPEVGRVQLRRRRGPARARTTSRAARRGPRRQVARSDGELVAARPAATAGRVEHRAGRSSVDAPRRSARAERVDAEVEVQPLAPSDGWTTVAAQHAPSRPSGPRRGGA